MATYKDVLLLIDKVSQPLKKIAENTEKTQKKITKFSDKLKEFGNKFGRFSGRLVAFSKKAAVAILAIGGAIVTIGKTMIRYANKYAEMGDRIDKMSQKIGMSRKAFQEWDYIMSQNGGNVESLQMGFKTLVTQIDGVRKGSKESIRAFKQLGVNVKDSKGQLRSADDVFYDTIRALQKIKDPTQKMILANRLFGRSAAELRPLLNQEAETIEKLREKADKMFVLTEDEVKAAAAYKDQMDTFGRYFDAKFASVMIKIMPSIVDAMEEIMKLVEENKQVFDDIGLAIKWVISKGLPAVIKALLIIEKIIQFIYVGIPMFLSTLGQKIGMSIYKAFHKLKRNIIIEWLKLTKSMAQASEAIGQAFANILGKIKEWVQWIIEKINWIINKVPMLNSAVQAGNRIAQHLTNNNVTNNTSTVNNYGNTTNYGGMFPFQGALLPSPF